MILCAISDAEEPDWRSGAVTLCVVRSQPLAMFSYKKGSGRGANSHTSSPSSPTSSVVPSPLMVRGKGQEWVLVVAGSPFRARTQPSAWVGDLEPSAGRGGLGWKSGRRGGRVWDNCDGAPVAASPTASVLVERHAVVTALVLMVGTRCRGCPQLLRSFFGVVEKNHSTSHGPRACGRDSRSSWVAAEFSTHGTMYSAHGCEFLACMCFVKVGHLSYFRLMETTKLSGRLFEKFGIRLDRRVGGPDDGGGVLLSGGDEEDIGRGNP